MICITSLAGVRMAKAYAAMQEAMKVMGESPGMGNGMAAAKAMQEFDQAARAVAEELKAKNFHEMTGP